MDYQPLNNFVCLAGYAFAIVIYVIQKYLIEPYFNKLKALYPEKKYIWSRIADNFNIKYNHFMDSYLYFNR